MDELIGRIYYGIGIDDGGYYVAVRLEVDGKQVDWEATARFEDSEDAIEFMLRLADEIEANGLSGGLTMTQRPWSGPW